MYDDLRPFRFITNQSAKERGELVRRIDHHSKACKIVSVTPKEIIPVGTSDVTWRIVVMPSTNDHISSGVRRIKWVHFTIGWRPRNPSVCSPLLNISVHIKQTIAVGDFVGNGMHLWTTAKIGVSTEPSVICQITVSRGVIDLDILAAVIARSIHPTVVHPLSRPEML